MKQDFEMHTRECPEMNNPYFTKKMCFALFCALQSRNACHQENYISNLVLPLSYKTQKSWNMWGFFNCNLNILFLLFFFCSVFNLTHTHGVLFLLVSLFHIIIKKHVLKWFSVQHLISTFLACHCKSCFLVYFF